MDNYLLILNLPTNVEETALLNEISPTLNKNNTTISSCKTFLITQQDIPDLKNLKENIDGKKIFDKNIKAFFYKDIKKIPKCEVKDVKIGLNFEDETILYQNKAELNVLRNKVLEDPEVIFTQQNALNSKFSDSGNFLILFLQESVQILSENFEVFNEFFIAGGVDFVMNKTESIIAVIDENKKVCVFDIFKGNKICEIQNFKKKFTFKNNLIFDETVITESFEIKKLNDFFNLKEEKINFFSANGENFAYFTNNTINFVGEKNNQKKSHVNVVDIKFYWPNDDSNTLICFITKKVRDRTLYNVESYNSKISMIQENENVEEIKFSEKNLAIKFTDKIKIYENKNDSFFLIKEIKSEQINFDVIGSKIAILNLRNKTIEIFVKSKLIRTIDADKANEVIWSQSGLFLAAISRSNFSSGYINMYDVNGNFLWKKIANSLKSFEFKNFKKLSQNEKDEIKNNYEESIELLGDQKNINVLRKTEDIDTEKEKEVWINFLKKQKELYNNFILRSN